MFSHAGEMVTWVSFAHNIQNSVFPPTCWKTNSSNCHFPVFLSLLSSGTFISNLYFRYNFYTFLTHSIHVLPFIWLFSEQPLGPSGQKSSFKVSTVTRNTGWELSIPFPHSFFFPLTALLVLYDCIGYAFMFQQITWEYSFKIWCPSSLVFEIPAAKI